MLRRPISQTRLDDIIYYNSKNKAAAREALAEMKISRLSARKQKQAEYRDLEILAPTRPFTLALSVDF